MMVRTCVLALCLGVGVATAEEVSPGIFRTPEHRFDGLKDYLFESRYTRIGQYRVHYLDEGPADGETVRLLHGEPGWSYLYRKMITLDAMGIEKPRPTLHTAFLFPGDDGRLRVVCDSTPIIRRLEALYPGRRD